LAEAIAAGTRIIVTTLQKLPFVLDKVKDLPKRNYAIIVDEAHSSQTGESAGNLRRVLAATTLEQAEQEERKDESAGDEIEEAILKAIRSRGPQKNLSFFAFTATPKHKTLELFGRDGPDGKPQPFHLYSMRQAIEEGFILDVLPLVKAVLVNPVMTVDPVTITFPVKIESGCYLEFNAMNDCKLYGPQGQLLQEVTLRGEVPVLQSGNNRFEFRIDTAVGTSPRAYVTVISQGRPLEA